MPAIDLSILNQRQTPAFYADVFANRPAAGFVGRIFVSTDTFAFYRDNGTGWDLIGGPGTGTVTGSGAAGQVAFWSGASLISGENNLWWDSANNHLGINTNTPATALDVNHNGTLVAKFNNTTTTSTLLAFENAGNEQWWIGTENTNNDFLFYDATNFPTLSLRTTFKTNGQVLIGTSSIGSGKLVVASTTSDNGIQIAGTAAPSLRIDNAVTGPSLRMGLGIATSTNDFIQNSAPGEVCIFSAGTTPQPITFGIYDTGIGFVVQAARLSAARNFLIGTTTDNGNKLQISGTTSISSKLGIGASPSGGESLQVYGTSYLQQNTSIGGINASCILDVNPSTNTAGDGIRIQRSNVNTYTLITAHNSISKISAVDINSGVPILAFNRSVDGTTFTENARFGNTGNLLIGTTTDAGQKLQVSGTALISGNTTIGIATAATNLEFNLNGVSGKAQRIQFQNNGTNQWLLGAGAASETSAFELFNASGTIVISVDKTTNVTTINAPIAIGNTVTAAVGVASTHKVSILINGVQYYLLASNV